MLNMFGYWKMYFKANPMWTNNARPAQYLFWMKWLHVINLLCKNVNDLTSQHSKNDSKQILAAIKTDWTYISSACSGWRATKNDSMWIWSFINNIFQLNFNRSPRIVSTWFNFKSGRMKYVQIMTLAWSLDWCCCGCLKTTSYRWINVENIFQQVQSNWIYYKK